MRDLKVGDWVRVLPTSRVGCVGQMVKIISKKSCIDSFMWFECKGKRVCYANKRIILKETEIMYCHS